MFTKIKLLKLFDKIFGSFLSLFVRLIISPRHNDNASISKILIIRPGGIGDAVLLFPSLAFLKENYPELKIDVLAEKRNSSVFKMSENVNQLFEYDSSDLLKIYTKKYDAVIDTEQWHKLSSVIAYLTRAPIKIGFNTNTRSELHTSSVRYSHDDYEAQSFMNLIEVICDNNPKFDPNKKFISIEDSQFHNQDSNFVHNSNKTIAIFFGATVDERKWGITNYSELSNKLIDKGYGIVLLGGKSDEYESELLLSKIENKKELHNFVGKTSLQETAYIISKLDLLISGDSGLMHLAYGLGVKTLSLFGAGIEAKWAPKGKNNIVINKKLPCSPCTSFGYTPKCPIGVKCLKDITVDEVFSKTLSILNS